MLTPTDVEQKTFSTALRGYDLDEVDDFLDEIVATLRQLNDELGSANGTAGAPAAAMPAPSPEPQPEPESELEPVAVSVADEVTPAEPVIDESAIGRALLAAQTAADNLLEEAQEQASKIVDDAKGEADTWRVERDSKKAEAEAEMAALAARVSAIRSELSVLAGELADKLDEMDAVIEGESNGDVEESTETAVETEVVEIETVGTEATDDSGDEDGDDSGDGDEEVDGEPGAEETTDQLDQMLNGVASDLQLTDDEDAETDEDE